MALSIQEQYNELSFYTLAHQDISFIHQHIVEAQVAQTATSDTKPKSIIFSLVGLYLFIKKSYTGRQIQQRHMQMAKNKKTFPAIILPAKRGDISVSDVLAKPPGQERDKMIAKSCASVWNVYQNNRDAITNITALH